MGNEKGPTEGGSGGKRGHSNMEHGSYTEEIKEFTGKHRRKEDKSESEQGVRELHEDEDSSS